MNAPGAITSFPKRRALPADWSDHHDSRLRDAKGRYGKIAKLSDEWGIATGALVARWHILRAGPAPARAQPKPVKLELRDAVPFERMRAAVTPQMVRVVDYLRRRGAVPVDTLAWDLRLARKSLNRCLERNAPRLHKAGWQVARTQGGQQGSLLKLEKLS